MKLVKGKAEIAARGLWATVIALHSATPGRSTLVLLCLIAAGMMESIGILALLPLIGFVAGVGADASSSIGQKIVQVFATFGAVPTFELVLIVVIAAIGLKTVITYLALRVAGFAAYDFCADFRSQMIHNLLHMRWPDYIQESIGRITNSITNEVNQAGNTYTAVTSLLATVIQVIVLLGLAVLTSWQTTLGAIVGGMIIMFLLRSVIPASDRAGDELVRSMNSMTGRLVEGLTLMKPLKAMAREDVVAPILEKENRNYNFAQQQYYKLSILLTNFHEFLVTIALVVVIYICIHFLNYPFAEFLFLAVLFYRLVSRLGQIQVTMQKLAGLQAYYWSARRLLDSALSKAEFLNPGGQHPHLRKAIAFDGVSFGYNDKLVLDNLSIRIPTNSVTVVYGPSGVGKSTLIDLITGLLNPTSGQVMIDDLDLAICDLKSWRNQIGYVSQESILLQGSVYQNVTLGDDTIARDAVKLALQQAGAWDFVASLPQEMDTLLEERGSNLSGGQRQRIAIARAIVRRPELLVLDEPTASLDATTELEICRNIRDLSRDTTIVVVSHQPAWLNVATQTFRMEELTASSRGVDWPLNAASQ